VNTELIVGEIDAEIEKLKQIRLILEQLLTQKIAEDREAATCSRTALASN